MIKNEKETRPANTNQRFANAVPVSPFHAYTVKSHAVLVQVPVYFSQMLRPSTALVWVCVSRYVCPPSVFFIFYLFLTFFVIFASSGAKIFQEMENYNFRRVFSFFYRFSFFSMFLSFLLPVVELMKNDKK